MAPCPLTIICVSALCLISNIQCCHRQPLGSKGGRLANHTKLFTSSEMSEFLQRPDVRVLLKGRSRRRALRFYRLMDTVGAVNAQRRGETEGQLRSQRRREAISEREARRHATEKVWCGVCSTSHTRPMCRQTVVYCGECFCEHALPACSPRRTIFSRW